MVQSALPALPPEQQTHRRRWSGRVQSSERGLGHRLRWPRSKAVSSVPEAAWSPSLQTESNCPRPLPCRDCPALGCAKWGRGGWRRGEPPVSHVCPFHLLSRQEGRGCGNPGHVAYARVALSPSGVRTGISSGFVSPTFILTVTAGDLLPQVQETLAALAAVEGMDGSQDLFRAHVSPLLEWLAASHRDWTGHSVELLQLDVVLSHSGEPGRVPRAGFRAWVPWRLWQPQRRQAALLSPPSRPRTRPGSSFTRDHCRLWGLATLHPYFKKC